MILPLKWVIYLIHKSSTDFNMDLDVYSEPDFPLDFDDRDLKDASEEDYDAINEETFGGDVGDIADLEEFANQVCSKWVAHQQKNL